MPDPSEMLIDLLSRGVAGRAQLQKALDVSQATFSRLVSSLGERIVTIGGGRSTRYALRRPLPQAGSTWPVFAVDAHGAPALLGRLHALARDQYWFAAAQTRDSLLTDGLPYFLQDLWPQGFIGRTAPRRYPELELPARITDWNDAHVLTYLCRRGEDSIGNLIVGDESLQRFLRAAQSEPRLIDAHECKLQYLQLADAALAGEPAGSSAGGEHPKFTTTYRTDGADPKNIRHVLVKFSPPAVDAVSRRWADLLICEHLASETLRQAGLPAATTELVISGERVFLESQRFDRIGLRGRVGVVTLAALADHLLGRRDNWISASRSLLALGKVSASDLETIRRIETFGRLIANTDMHFGNLSFFLSLHGPFTLAPAYDMLPMLYAPGTAGALLERNFEPPLPTADSFDIWPSMTDLAQRYWQAVAGHERISPEFAARARDNAQLMARRTLR